MRTVHLLAPLAFFMIFFSPQKSRSDSGFFQLNDPRVPNAVRTKADSVYQIFVLSPAKKLTLVSQGDYPSYLKNIERNTSGLMRFWKLLEFNLFGNGKKSFSPSEVSFGTAFLHLNHFTLLTSREVFARDQGLPRGYQQAKTPLQAKNALKDYLPRIVLVNHKGAVVLDAVSPMTRMRIKVRIPFHGHPSISEMLPSPIRDLDDATKSELTDLFEIILPVPLNADPLELSSTSIAPGQRVYSLSYPAETTGRELEGGLNSSGEGLWASAGVVRKAEAGIVTDSWVVSDLDMAQGSGGAPVFDEKGNVVGVFGNQSRTLDASYCIRLLMLGRRQ